MSDLTPEQLAEWQAIYLTATPGTLSAKVVLALIAEVTRLREELEAAEVGERAVRALWAQESAHLEQAEADFAVLKRAADDEHAESQRLRDGITALADYWMRRSIVVCSNCQYHPDELRDLLKPTERTET